MADRGGVIGRGGSTGLMMAALEAGGSTFGDADRTGLLLLPFTAGSGGGTSAGGEGWAGFAGCAVTENRRDPKAGLSRWFEREATGTDADWAVCKGWGATNGCG